MHARMYICTPWLPRGLKQVIKMCILNASDSWRSISIIDNAITLSDQLLKQQDRVCPVYLEMPQSSLESAYDRIQIKADREPLTFI